MEKGKRAPVSRREYKKQLIIRALTDPKFRKLLETEPMKALGVEHITPENQVELRFVLSAVKAIDHQIVLIADELLCANGGPCGIA